MPRSRFLFVICIALVAVAAVLLQPSRGAEATLFRPGGIFRTCTDGTGEAYPTLACTVNYSPSTVLDSLSGFDIAPPDSNFGGVIAYTPDTRFSVAADAALPNGAVVGELRSLATLGLINGGCFTQLLVDFTFVDATTDFTTAGQIIAPAGPSANRLLNLGQDDGDTNNDKETSLIVAAIATDTVLKVTNAASFVNGETVRIGPTSPETKIISAHDASHAGTVADPDTITLTVALASPHAVKDVVVTPDNVSWSFNGIPDGADGYPSYVAASLDPDGAGPALPLQPRARFLGVALVPKSATGVVVILQYLIMEPGALRALPGGGGAAASLGYPTLTVLQDPTEAPTNGAISDFCTPLATTTALDGTTRDNDCTRAGGGGPADCAFPITVDSVDYKVNLPVEPAACGGTVPDECGTPRFSTLAVGAGGATATYVVQSQAIRALDDGDGHENTLDPCPKTNDSAWDPRTTTSPPPGDADGDGLPTSCDPDETIFGFDDDQDDDGWLNRQENCSLDKNGDTTSTAFEAIGSTAINVASTDGFPSAAPFIIDIDAGTIRERRTVSAITPGTPGIFTISVGVSTSHLTPVNVNQIFQSNVNHGQGDFDIPLPGVVLEGTRGDGVGTQCDSGVVGSETLSTTAPQGHYHRTASIARVCITSSPGADDTDGDGVCNAQEPLAASCAGGVNDDDCDNDATAVGEPERIYDDDSVAVGGTVGTGDVRKTATATGLAVGLSAGTAASCGPDFDCGRALLNFLADEKYTDDEPATASRYDVNECVYRDVDSSGAVSNGDVRLHTDVADVPVFEAPSTAPPDASPNCNYAGGSTVVCAGDTDCTVVLNGFDLDEKHNDSRDTGAGLTATGYRNRFQTCTNRVTDDSDTDIDFADTNCLGAHFDRFDDCISAANTAPVGFSQTDADGDGLGDACDGLVDSDLDGTSDTQERHIGTGLDTVCSRDSTSNNEPIDAQPEDLTDDRSVTGADLSAIASDIGNAVPPAPVRKDIANLDNAITGAELSKVAGKIGTACSP